MKTKALPTAVAKLLHGEIEEDRHWTALTALGLDYYRSGRTGQIFEPVADPGGLLEATERVNRFLLCCWVQGQEAAGAQP